MRAVGFRQPGSIEDAVALEERDLVSPEPGPRDLLVAVEAVSVNPVDAKLRQGVTPEEGFKVLGYDAAGHVEAVGSDVRDFAVGDEVFYAGDVRRPGSNAEYQCVDERLVARKPTRLDMAESAALPLVTLTARECLAEHLGFMPDNAAGRTLLVVGGAGGVGSMAIQIGARHLGMNVIATAGRSESADWCRKMGAAHTLAYRQGLVQPVRALGHEFVDGMLLAVQPDPYWQDACELIAPFGRIAGIVDAEAPLDLNRLKPKSASAHWEFMFARAIHGWNMHRQGEILAEAARLVDEEVLTSPVTENLGGISAANLIEAHRRIESGKTMGKLVLGG